MAPGNRGPTSDDHNRMDEIRKRQQQPSGDPRMSGERGTKDSPLYVRWAGMRGGRDDREGGAGFFDSFRAPKAHEGPQRQPGQAGTDHTGERSFQAAMQSHQAVAEQARQITNELKSAASAAAAFTVDMSKYGSEMREAREIERQRVDKILSRIEKSFSEQGDGGGGGRGRRSGPDRPAGPSTENPHGWPGRHRADAQDLDDIGPNGQGAPIRSGDSRPSDAPTSDPDDEGRVRPNRRDRSRPRAARRGGGGDPTQLGYHEARASHHHGSVKRAVQRQAAEFYHQEFGQGTNERPTPVKVEAEDGSVQYQMVGEGGQVLETMSEEQAHERGLITKARNAAFISRMAGGLSRGGLGGAVRAGMTGAMGAAGSGGAVGAMGTAMKVGMKAVPFVGTAVAVADAANETLKYAQDQRAKNAFYQSIYGGSNTEGFGDRFKEEGFVWSQRLKVGLQEEQARQLFKGVSAMGYDGPERDRMTDFGQQNYKDLGMGVEQSLQALELASKNAGVSVTGLSKGLREVTKTARETGQSAAVWQQRFINTTGAAMQAGMGTASTQVAGAMTGAVAGMGRGFENMDMSGVLQEDRQRLLAAQQGLTYGQLLAQNEDDPTAMFEAQDAQVKAQAESIITPEMQKIIDTRVSEAGGWDKIKDDPDATARLGKELLKQGDLDPGAVRSLLESNNIDVTGMSQEKMDDAFINILSGNGALGPESRKREEAQQIHGLRPEERASSRDIFSSPLSDTPSQFVQDNTNSFMEGALGILGSGVSSDKNAVTEAYGERQAGSGQVEPAVEAMINELGDNGDIGIEVETADGKQVVSQSDAVKYYSDQINRGTAKIVGGTDEQDGKTVGDLTGVVSDNVPEDQDTTTDPANKGDGNGSWWDKALGIFGSGSEGGEGVSAEDWKADHPNEQEGEEGSGSGKIKIEATDELRRFLKITGSGNVDDSQVTEAAGAGVPPAGGNVLP